MKRTLQLGAGWFLLAIAPLTLAQVKVGDDVQLQMNGTLTGGYSANYGDQIQSSHNLNIGGDANLSGDYYNPNFLNFTVNPYYNRSSANSSFLSLTDSSGVNSNANFFTGSRFPGFATFNYARNASTTNGLIGAPNFTTVGNSYGFGVGWSVLLPDKPTFSISYMQGSGGGNIYGTTEESHSSTKTLNLRSTYEIAGWRLNGGYEHLRINSTIPFFLTNQQGTDTSNYSANYYNVNAYHKLAWNGSIGASYIHTTYSGNFGSQLLDEYNYNHSSSNTENVNVNFHPTQKLGLFATQSYTDNLSGYFYQSVFNGGGVPIVPQESNSKSTTLSAGASYLITKNIYSSAQINFYDQSYLGKHYNGSYFSGTVGYNKRILETFTVSATVIESTNKFADNSLGFILNVGGFRHFGPWETSGNYSYAQNVQTILVTYTTSYSNYGLNLHRRLGRGKQWTGAFNGTHSGFSRDAGTDSHSESFSTSLALRRLTLTGNYTQSHGQSLLTSTGITPIPPTPGLLPQGLIVYDGTSYGASIGVSPIPRLSITGTYSHAVSDTLSNSLYSKNRTEIYYTQMQYRLRRISLLAGFTKFSQGISVAGTPPGSQYSYFIGVSRWINFF